MQILPSLSFNKYNPYRENSALRNGDPSLGIIPHALSTQNWHKFTEKGKNIKIYHQNTGLDGTP